jgi:hypothetical protein
MNFMLDLNPAPPAEKISYRDKIMIVGSCFTEHIGNKLLELKFQVLQNPNGILFDPRSVTYSLLSYIQQKKFKKEEIFNLNEVWQSWQHHSRFSHMDAETCLAMINESQQQAHSFLKEANWLIITLGSSFSYHLTNQTPDDCRKGVGHLRTNEFLAGGEVANCHRAPAQWFYKHLMTIDEIHTALDGCIHQLWQFNPALKILFTISPVRHIRDGVVENNRSKARLIEVVHHLVNKFDGLYYFPAYELVIDVLRDYRFYDIDMVHPNYAATEFILEKFLQSYIDEESIAISEEVKKITTARKHKAFQPNTKAHQQFLKANYAKTQELLTKYPFLNLKEELDFFERGVTVPVSHHSL